MEFEAFAGKPYGVGRIVVDLPENMLPQPLGADGLAMTERDGRVLYPAVETPAFAKIMKEVLDSDSPLTRGGPVREQVGGRLRGIIDPPPRTTIYFLFRGDGPLHITLQARLPISIDIIPRQRRRLRISDCSASGGDNTPGRRNCSNKNPTIPLWCKTTLPRL